MNREAESRNKLTPFRIEKYLKGKPSAKLKQLTELPCQNHGKTFLVFDQRNILEELYQNGFILKQAYKSVLRYTSLFCQKLKARTKSSDKKFHIERVLRISTVYS